MRRSTILAVCFIVCSLVVIGLVVGEAGAARGAGLSPPAAEAQVAAGYTHTVALRSDGSVWAWGGNQMGQLGIGDDFNRYAPTRVGGENDWVALACGAYHTLALKSDGSLWAWGWNNRGMLGLGDTDSRSVPTRVGSASDWTAIAAGYEHSLALKSDGSLWAWGYNVYGSLGVGDTTDRAEPTRVGTTNDWTALAAGMGHSLALKSDGSLWAWGFGNSGQLGLGDEDNRTTPNCVGSDSDWAMVAGGGAHTMAIKSNGSLWAWGSSSSGALGLGTSYSRSSPTRVGSANDWGAIACGDSYTSAVKSDGSLWTCGANYYGQLGLGDTAQRDVPTRVGTRSDWVTTCCGCYHTVPVESDGSLWTWGYNHDGELGLGDTTNRSSPTLVPASDPAGWSAHPPRLAASNRSGVAKANGALLVWGQDGGLLGIGGSGPDQLAAVRLGAGSDWTALSYSLYHSTALKSDGSLWAWGSNSLGQVGDGTHLFRSSPVRVGSDNDWTAAACGTFHTLAVKNDGSLWSWGYNIYGQLGLGDTSERTSPSRIGGDNDWTAVAAGNGQSLAIKSDGSLWAWGWNDHGQLGLGDTSDRASPERVGSGNDWVAAACGPAHTVALKSNGSLWAWGYNAINQLGLGDTVDRSVPTRVGAENDWTAVSCGGGHCLALKSGGSLWAWGWNPYGQLGLGDTSPRAVPTRVGSGSDWIAVAAGFHHSLGARSNGDLLGWGENVYGQLGDGTTDQRNAPVLVASLADTVGPVIDVSSSTHPDPGQYVADSDPALSWSAQDTSGVLGYSYVLDQAPGTVPDTTIDTTDTALSYTDLADGIWYFHIRGQDGVFNWSETTTREIRIDTTGPAGVSMTIDGGAAATGSTSVTLTVTGTDVSLPMSAFVRNAGDLETGPVAIGAGTVAWTLVPGDGSKTVEVRLVDALGNSSGWVSDQIDLDQTGPTGGSVTVGDGSGYSNTRGVTLHLTATDPHGPLEMQIRNAGDPWPAAWTPFSATTAWRLSYGDADKTVEARFRDAFANVGEVAAGEVTLDTVPPSGWLMVADGAYAINTHSTTVETWAGDMNGPVLMRVKNGGEAWPVGWSPSSGVQAWALPAGDGPKNVFAEFQDVAGNITLVSATVVVDTLAPSGGLAIDGGAAATNATAATLTISASDTTSPIEMRLRDAGGSWGDWQRQVDTVPWTLPGGDGEKVVEVQYRDIVGNVSDPVDDAILLDTVAPVTTDNAGVLLWHAGPFTFMLTPFDAASGMGGGHAATEYSTDGGVSWQTGASLLFAQWKRGGGSGIFTVLYCSTDAAGNTEAPKTATVMIDTSAPATRDDAPTTPRNTPVTVHFNGSDGYSGVATTWCSVDGGPWMQGTSIVIPAPADHSNDGLHTIRYYSVDNAGNHEVGYRVCAVTIQTTLGGTLLRSPSRLLQHRTLHHRVNVRAVGGRT